VTAAAQRANAALSRSGPLSQGPQGHDRATRVREQRNLSQQRTMDAIDVAFRVLSGNSSFHVRRVMMHRISRSLCF
jgi:hypothetical protein